MKAGRKIHRRPDEAAGGRVDPESQRLRDAITALGAPEYGEGDNDRLHGSFGPYIQRDTAEFHHAGREIREWFLRADADETVDLRYTIAMGRFIRGCIKWGTRIIGGFVTALGAVYAFGEKLGKLPETMHGAASGAFEGFRILRGWLGL